MNGKRIMPVLIMMFLAALTAWGDTEPGLIVARVLVDSPAEEAGLLRGDILLAIDGNEVNSVSDIREILSDYKAGQRVSLKITRGGKEQTLRLVLEERLYRPAIGVEFAVGRFSWDGGGPGFVPPRIAFGAIVVEVVEDGPADNAGMEEGDAILAIDGEQSSSEELGDIIAAKKPGDTVVLEISRPGRKNSEELEVSVTLGENDDGGALLGVRYLSPGGWLNVPELKERLERLDKDLRERIEERQIHVYPKADEAI